MNTLRPFAIASALLALASLSRADEGAAGSVTYARDVAPIFFSKCVQCHRPGQVAPMSFLSFKDVRPWAKSIKKAVTERTMPPWFADPKHGEFLNDSRLTDDQVAKIVAWVNQGAELGDVLDMPPAPKFRDDAWKLGNPDAVFTMPKAFNMPDAMEDHYQNFIVPTNLKEDRWVTKIELKPGNYQIVHHILVFVIPKGPGGAAANLSSDILVAALTGGGLISKYAPGNNPDIFPDGYGKLLPAGCSLLFQMHYHKEPGAGTATTDKSSMGVVFAKAPVPNPVTTAWIVNPLISIPPGAEGARSSSQFTFTDDGKIHALFPHMHYRGKAFKFEAQYPDGKTETLLDVPAYQFDWQLSYILKQPKQVPKGTKVKATGVFDNSANNPYNPDPSRLVTWGEETTDEMMLGLMDYTYDHNKKGQEMIGLPDGLSNLLPPDLKDMVGKLGK